MPLFLVTGAPTEALLRNADGKAGARAELALHEAAEACGARLVRSNLIAGTWRLVALFDMNSAAAARMLHAVVKLSVFAPNDVRLARMLSAEEVDEAIRLAGDDVLVTPIAG